MNLIIDTNLFLAICRGEEEAGRIFSKAIRVCDLVLVSESMIFEKYVDVLSQLD